MKNTQGRQKEIDKNTFRLSQNIRIRKVKFSQACVLYLVPVVLKRNAATDPFTTQLTSYDH